MDGVSLKLFNASLDLNGRVTLTVVVLSRLIGIRVLQRGIYLVMTNYKKTNITIPHEM